MEELEELNQPGASQVAQPGPDQPEYYQFRFMGQPIKIESKFIDTYDIIILSLIEQHGWWYYENLKVNYNYTLPSPDLEHIVNFKCMEKEISG